MDGVITTSLISLFVLTTVVVVHFEGLKAIDYVTNLFGISKRSAPPVIVFCVALLHFFEIILFATTLYIMYEKIGINGFEAGYSPENAVDYFYISGSNYTTLGISALRVAESLKIVAVIEALSGFIMITWSAAFLYASVGHSLHDNK